MRDHLHESDQRLPPRLGAYPGTPFDPLLKAALTPVIRQQRRTQLARHLAIWWSILAVSGFVFVRFQHHGHLLSPVWIFLLPLAGLVGATVILLRHRRNLPDLREIARQIESRHPALNGALLTAVQQQPGQDGSLNYLQEQVLRQAIEHNRSNPWTESLSWRIAGPHLGHALALLLFVFCWAGLQTRPAKHVPGVWAQNGVTVTPGDTSIERGERLTVIAQFDGSLPASVELVTSSGSEQPKHVPLIKSLSDPVFGGGVSEVTTDLVYHIEYAGNRTPDFHVKVFEYPRLERADADLTFPAYTALAPKRIENTHRLSAVEGSRLDLTLQFNKPVVSAQFVQKGASSNAFPLIIQSNQPLASLGRFLLQTNQTWLLQLVDAEGRTNKISDQFVLNVLKNREPELKLVSPRGDTRPSALEELAFEGTVWDDFGVQNYGLAYTVAGQETKFVELGKTTPGNEKRPFKYLLRLETLALQPDELVSWFLWADDIGPDGQSRRTVGDLYFAEIRPFEEVFREGQGGGGGGGGQQGGGGGQASQLADLQKQIISATWKLQRQHGSPSDQKTKPARDKPPKVGRAVPSAPQDAQKTLDLRSADFRHHPEGMLDQTIFAQRTPNDTPPDAPLTRVRTNLAKISGTNNTTSASQYVTDLGVVRDAVAQAIEQAQAARERQSGARNSTLWDDVIQDMEKAHAQLDQAVKSPPSLSEALAAEQAAYQALLKLQQREYEITRNRNRSQNSSGSRAQQMQRQLGQLDLTQPEDRYENEKLAQAPQSAERREQLQVMNRLAELARRQQDLNDRLKELQTALQEARTEQEREEIKRRLKRLQEEEQRMLADVDELKQRMDRPENQSQMTEQRQQLDQTRQEIQRAANAAQEDAVSQALASGTRAQRQLQQMREDMRKKNSSEFAEDLRQLRSEAADAARRQQEIQKQMDSLAESGHKTLDDSQARRDALDQLTRQQQRLTNLVEHATQLSQQTEEAEPIASRELYDTLRKFSQDNANTVREFQDEFIQRGLVRTDLYERMNKLAKQDGPKSVELASEMLEQGLLPQARQAGNRAQSAVNDLRRGIERAAEKVLGDDTEALRIAQQQLDRLTGQLQREMTQSQTNATTNAQAQAASGAQTAQQSQSGPQGNEPRPSPAADAAPSGDRDQDQQSNQEAASAQRGKSGQQPGNGSQGQESQARSSGTAQDGSASRGQREGGRRAGGQNRGGNNNGGLPAGWDQFLEPGSRGGDANGPIITGDGYLPWSDTLREVEEMVDDATLQNRLASARERARVLRQEYRRSRESPDWSAVKSQVLGPLVEARDQIAEELARRGSRDNLVPIDRDPVPNRYSELVRKYYEQLSKDK
jgi:hypothetical protein